jgi:Glycoside Hydrolase Family 113
MKRRAFIIILSLLAAGILSGAHRFMKTTPESKFRHFKTARIDVAYLPSTLVAQNIKILAKQLENNLNEAESVLDIKLDEPLHAYIYNSFQEKGDHIREIQLADAVPKDKTIYCIWNKTFDGLAERMEYQVLLYEKFGQPANDNIARAVTAAMGERWNHKSLQDWERVLSDRDLIPDWNFFKHHEQKMSEFIIIPFLAMTANELKERYGMNILGEFYRSGILPAEFEAELQNPKAKTVAAINRTRKFTPEFQKGMTYAFWNSANAGYAGSKSIDSLRQLKTSGVEWIAAIPYGYMESHDSTKIHTAGHNIYGESDESMFQLKLDAQKLGIKIMMKPQIWISHEAWPGKINMDSPGDWDEWFDSYEQWIIHYALISELMHADLFCIGTEMVEATTQHPKRWREMIARVRQVYSGPIVYAANWGKEFEEITFWDALDYMGLDNYYPVRDSVEESPDIMRERFLEQKAKLKALATRWQKPLLFTEIGYMANEAAGMGSREDQYTKYDEKMQAECYKLALETYWNEPWFAGMYWWKWFSNPDDGGIDADAHSPHGRKAGRILAEWYKKERVP